MKNSRVAPRLGLGALVLSCLLPAVVWSQASIEERPVGSLEAGDWALQFQIIENFTLTSFDGLMLSVERHWNPRSALRLGVDLRVATSNDEYRSESADSLVNSTSVQDNSGDTEGFALKVQYVAYSNPDGRLHFYWAAGPSLSYYRSHNERTSTYTSSSSSSRAVESGDSDIWGAAVAGTMGIQWFVSRGIGLLAEYGASAGYEYVKGTTVRTQESPGMPVFRGTTEQQRDGFQFRSLGVRFGVAVHF